MFQGIEGRTDRPSAGDGLRRRVARLTRLAKEHQKQSGDETLQTAVLAGNFAAELESNIPRLADLEKAAGKMREVVADALIDRSDRVALMDTIEVTNKANSDRKKEGWKAQGNKAKADVVIVGSGPLAAAFVSQLQITNPGLSVIVLEQGKQAGGTFSRTSDQGRIGTFEVNNRTHRPDNPANPSTPGGNGDLLPFGRFSTVKAPDFMVSTYPTNAAVAAGVLTNLNLVEDPVLEMKATGYKKTRQGTTLEVVDTANNDQYEVSGKIVVFAGGIGEPDDKGLVDSPLAQASKDRFDALMSRTSPLRLSSTEDWYKIFPQVIHTDNLLQLIANRHLNRDIFRVFSQASVNIAGGGDSALVIAEYLTRLAPVEAYGRVSSQFGLPRSIDIFGCQFFNSLRNRYSQLADFVAGPGEFPTEATPIGISNEKVTNIGYNPLSYPFFEIEGKDRITSAIGILSTGYKTDVFGALPKTLVVGETYLGRQPVAAKAANADIYFIGAEAQIPVSAEELAIIPALAKFAGQDSKNVVAIWRAVPKAEAFADQVGQIVSAVDRRLEADEVDRRVAQVQISEYNSFVSPPRRRVERRFYSELSRYNESEIEQIDRGANFYINFLTTLPKEQLNEEFKSIPDIPTPKSLVNDRGRARFLSLLIGTLGAIPAGLEASNKDFLPEVNNPVNPEQEMLQRSLLTAYSNEKPIENLRRIRYRPQN